MHILKLSQIKLVQLRLSGDICRYHGSLNRQIKSSFTDCSHGFKSYRCSLSRNSHPYGNSISTQRKNQHTNGLNGRVISLAWVARWPNSPQQYTFNHKPSLSFWCPFIQLYNICVLFYFQNWVIKSKTVDETDNSTEV